MLKKSPIAGGTAMPEKVTIGSMHSAAVGGDTTATAAMPTALSHDVPDQSFSAGSSAPSYWIGVVSEAHVQRGVAGGFAQLCHGKAAPLRKMKRGDWFVYYSPRTEMKSGEPLQAFTAIGRVRDDEVYEYAMSDTFIPFRRNIDYVDCQQASIRGLLDQLSFTRDNRNWGYLFRRGQFQITADDFQLIAEAMGVEIQL